MATEKPLNLNIEDIVLLHDIPDYKYTFILRFTDKTQDFDKTISKGFQSMHKALKWAEATITMRLCAEHPPQ